MVTLVQTQLLLKFLFVLLLFLERLSLRCLRYDTLIFIPFLLIHFIFNFLYMVAPQVKSFASNFGGLRFKLELLTRATVVGGQEVGHPSNFHLLAGQNIKHRKLFALRKSLKANIIPLETQSLALNFLKNQELLSHEPTFLKYKTISLISMTLSRTNVVGLRKNKGIFLKIILCIHNPVKYEISYN